MLVFGETGTGKELAARAVHEQSVRAEMPLVPVNCGALPENLIESELFGHRKGAFTGADEHRVGLFEVANGGTLFLDEIGELPKAMQAKLLRFLESGEIRRVGENESFTCDVRVVCATHRAWTPWSTAGRVPRGPLVPHQHLRDPACRRCASGPDDLPLLARHLAAPLRRGRRPATPKSSRPRPWPRWRSTPGRATSASWPT